MAGKPIGALVTLSVTWDGEMTRPPQDDDIFCTRLKSGSVGSVYATEEIRGGPRYYRITAIKIDPESYDGDFDWELYWFSRAPT